MPKATLHAENGWSFDFTDFNSDVYERMNEHLRNGHVTELVPILARIIVTCPYGDPKDEMTWRTLNIIPFLTLGKVIGDALNAEVKKFLETSS
jgi:hypothetical protein